MTQSIARRVLWAVVAAMFAAALFSYFGFEVPLTVTLALGALCVLSAWRPFDALLVFIAVCGVAGALQVLVGAGYRAPFALVEAALFAISAGAAVRAAVRGVPIAPTPFDLALLGFAAVCAASAVSLLPTMFLRMGVETLEHARRALPPSQFFAWAPGTPVIDQAMLVFESVALAMLGRRLVANSSDRAERLIVMFLAGAAAAAALNVLRLLEIIIRQEDPLGSIVPALGGLRLNTQYGDLNAAGSYFAMAAVMCAAFSGVHTARQRVLLSVLPLFGCALWITGSRVAMAAALVCIAVVLARRAASGRWRRMAPAMAAVALVSVIVAASAIFVFRTSRHGSLSFSTSTRAELLKTGLAMARERPVAGIGLAQFYTRFPEFASAELLAAFKDATGREIRHENAHNQFVQYVAELGVIGLACFVAALWFAVYARDPVPPWRVAVLGAIGAFTLTSLAGHPLLTRGAAYPFWILLGAAASGASPLARGSSRWLGRGLVALVVILAFTLPARWRIERAAANLEHATIGMSPADRDESGERFQWAGRRASIFVDGRAGLIRVPLRSPDVDPRVVRILLDGAPADVVTIAPGGWRRIPVVLPANEGAPAFRRLDLEVELPAGTSGDQLLMVGRVVTP